MYMKIECFLFEGSSRIVFFWGIFWIVLWGLRSEGFVGIFYGWSGGFGYGFIVSRGVSSFRIGYWLSYLGIVFLLWCFYNLYRSDYMLNMLVMKCLNVE